MTSDTITRAITVNLNGESREVPAGLTLDGLLRHVGRDPGVPGFAVALRDRVVRRALWTETAVEEGDRVEIVTAAQGG